MTEMTKPAWVKMKEPELKKTILDVRELQAGDIDTDDVNGRLGIVASTALVPAESLHAHAADAVVSENVP